MADFEVDVNLLERRLAPISATEIRTLSGGASSLSYVANAVIDGTTRPVVVKLAPPGLAPVRNRDVLRQARLLRRLGQTSLPVPRVVWEDAGAPPEVPPLFVMSFIEGSSLEPLFDETGTDDPTIVAARMRDAARVLGTLHIIDPAELDLADEPAFQLGDEVERWARALGTVDDDLAPGWQAVAEALRAAQPTSLPPTIVHGDFRLGNLLAVEDRVTAVIDWEIWSIGDPRPTSSSTSAGSERSPVSSRRRRGR